MTPQKRRTAGANDFYALLKSPDIRNSEDAVKRRSRELNSAINKSPNPAAMKELSQTLKTRLNYANIKVQHGWNSIDEVEDALLTPKQQHVSQFSSPMSALGTPMGTPLQPPQFSPRPLSTFSTPYSTRRRGSMRLDDVANRGVSNTSPDKVNVGLLMASPVKNAKRSSLGPPAGHQTFQLPQLAQMSPMQQSQPQQLPPISTIMKPNEGLEQDAILSLMSMSSPVKYSHSQSSSISESSPSPTLGKATLATRRRSSHARGHSITNGLGMGMPVKHESSSAIVDDETEEEEVDEDSMLQPAFESGAGNFVRASADADSTDDEDTTVEAESFEALRRQSTAEEEHTGRDPFRETTFDERRRKMTTFKK